MDVTDAVAANRQRVVGFADVVRIPLRRWRVVLAVLAAVTLLVLMYLFFFPATYRASTVVVLRPVVTDPFTYPSSGADRVINMTAENGVALGNQVIDNTARSLGQDPDDVRDALTVEVPTGGQVLRFQYTDDAEDKAVTGANTAAQTYLRVRESIYQQQREALLLSYENGGHALLSCSLLGDTPGRATVVGTRGRITLEPRFHHTTRIVLERTGHDAEEVPAELLGRGYTHQMAHVAQCLADGLTQSPAMPLEDTLAVMGILDDALELLGAPHVDEGFTPPVR